MKPVATKEFIKQRREERLELAKFEYRAVEKDMNHILSQLSKISVTEDQKSFIEYSYRRKLGDIGSVIGNLKKKLGIPTQKEIKIRKKEASTQTPI